MIQFSKLRLNGFKSFVDKTELDISQGLTGIVGPNGCGKSNLVEALRWSMGETSSKRMRGGSGSMEDVIFNGTEKRPARNFAEVTVVLDNTARSAPSMFNDTDEIEVVRRIERDKGSDYKINSAPVRAKDVQLLYADLMSGAHSPYLVSQGKVTAMIQAKPLDRRQILEEAAGITGLYARRHEAELRLKAADNNLKRLEDVVGGMETRLQDLKKQGRQASRYRNLSAQIRQLEIVVATLEWRRAHERLQEIRKTFGEIDNRVAERMTVVSQLTRTHATQSADLPELRQGDAELGASLQVQKLALQRLEDEAQGIENMLADARINLDRARTDRSHESLSLSENSSILERLSAEEEGLQAEEENKDSDLAARQELRDKIQIEVDTIESEFTRMMEIAASDRARRQGIEQQIATDRGRLDAVRTRLNAVITQLNDKKNAGNRDEEIAALRRDTETLEQKTALLQESVQMDETALKEARQSREKTQESLHTTQDEKSRLDAEIAALESVLEMYVEGGFRPVIEDIKAEEGFETALSRALGDTLTASTDTNAPVSWTERSIHPSALPSLPHGAMALETHVDAPAPLRLALSQVGYVTDDDEGNLLAPQLRPGQSLVSKNGAYWRWDGLHIKAEASDSHAVQLKQKNQLADLQAKLPKILEKLGKAQQVFDDSNRDMIRLQSSLEENRLALKTAENTLRDNRNTLHQIVESQSTRQAELSRLEEALSIATADIGHLEVAIAGNNTALESFDERLLEERQRQVEESREKLSETRIRLQDAIRDLEIARQDQSRRKARLHAIADERINLQNRCIRARERVKELEERDRELTEKIATFEKRPGEIRESSQGLLSSIAEIESLKSVVSDKLATLESELAETAKGLKEAESALAEVREARAHAMATISERQSHLEEISAHIHEQFSMPPEELQTEAAIDPDNAPDIEELKQEKDKAIRSRDLIGPVNLCADQEAEELEKQLTGIFTERNDLMEAIAELRQGINKLNAEARDRLMTAFDQVNTHFQDMFIRLFHGGKAYLSLIESDDPLEAGLEIYAQPPGKALQSLSLLSGGEQTLTATALIFAMFLTNPSPICVLDEVDAPLDDANVDRFCDVLQEFASKGQTRFLIITHHRLTMARMDRLYGVTMGEKGVSQLVSVDLSQQLDFLEAA